MAATQTAWRRHSGHRDTTASILRSRSRVLVHAAPDTNTQDTRVAGTAKEDTEDTEDTDTLHVPAWWSSHNDWMVQRRLGLSVSFVGRRIIRRPGAAPGVGAAGALLSPEGVAGSRRPPRRTTPAKTGYRPGQGAPRRARRDGSDRQVCHRVADSTRHYCSRTSRCPCAAPRPPLTCCRRLPQAAHLESRVGPTGRLPPAARRCASFPYLPAPRVPPPASSSLLRPALNYPEEPRHTTSRWNVSVTINMKCICVKR